MLASFALALQLTGLQAIDLRPGESLHALAPAPTPAAEPLTGRILDAHTARPIADATVELWSEEIDERAGGFRRFHVARTGRDGRFQVLHSEGASLAEKARVTAPGYLPRSGTRGDLFEPLSLSRMPAEPVVVRVEDSAGRPIAGARFTTTLSCAHDLSAFHAETDRAGFATLEGYGPSEAVPELRLSAPGYGYIEYLWDDDAALASRRDAPFTVVLPRVRPLDLRVLDRAGRPAGAVALRLVAGDGEHVRWTDYDGRVRFESHAATGGSLYVLGGVGDRRSDAAPDLDVGYLATLDPFVPYPVTVRPDGLLEGEKLQDMAFSEDFCDGATRFVMERSAAEAYFPLRGALFDMESGRQVPWSLDSGEEQTASTPVPLFRVGADSEAELVLAWGGAFSGVEAGRMTLEPRAHETLVLPFHPRAEPRIAVRAPGGRLTWLQAGDTTLFDVEVAGSTERDSEPALLSVPANRELTLLFDNGRERRLVRHPGLPSPTSPTAQGDSPPLLDLTDDRTVVWRAPAPGPLVELAVLGARADELRVEGAPCEVEVRAADDGSARLIGPAGTEFLVELRREGCARTFTRCTLPAPQWMPGTAQPVPLRVESPPLWIEAVPLASLILELPEGFAVEGLSAQALAGLAPGPLDLVLRHADGRAWMLALELAPGESRRIALRE